MGLNGIPSLILNECSSSLCYPLCKLFIKSITFGKIPSLQRLANVLPLFKNGINSDIKNYRPISLTSVCSKTFERLVVGQLNSYLESNGLLSNFQYGFRGDRFVSEQLLLTYDYVTKYVDEGCEVHVVLYDYRRLLMW